MLTDRSPRNDAWSGLDQDEFLGQDGTHQQQLLVKGFTLSVCLESRKECTKAFTKGFEAKFTIQTLPCDTI